MDLGECPKIHDLALVADYNSASKEQDYFYDVDVCDSLLYIFSFSFQVIIVVNCAVQQ